MPRQYNQSGPVYYLPRTHAAGPHHRAEVVADVVVAAARGTRHHALRHHPITLQPLLSARLQQLRLGVLAAMPVLLIVGNLVPLWFLFLMGGWTAMASGNPIVRGYITLARFELQSRRYAAYESATHASSEGAT